MNLPVVPPLTPMLARLSRELLAEGFLYEPKWDGFRCLVFRSGAEIDLRSRHDCPLARYFPELVEAFAELPDDRFVLDGEILAVTPSGFDFSALLARLHPAPSRVERLRRESPAMFVAFDLLAVGDTDLRERPFLGRRERLIALLETARPPLFVTPLTDDSAVASAWLDRLAAGVDGVVAKHFEDAYRPGARTMVKVKRERSADCVVAGFRWLVDRPLPSSLLLGLHDGDGALRHVGVAASFPEVTRRRILEDLAPLVAPLAGHPWENGFLLGGSPMGRLKGAAGRWTPEMGQDWVPVSPTRVCEVVYDHLDGDRFRHPVRFRRWRPDRDPASCGFDQFEPPRA
jgi:ATP-dependent DNA ligase